MTAEKKEVVLTRPECKHEWEVFQDFGTDVTEKCKLCGEKRSVPQ